jgi:hypothetical protein
VVAQVVMRLNCVQNRVLEALCANAALLCVAERAARVVDVESNWCRARSVRARAAIRRWWFRLLADLASALAQAVGRLYYGGCSAGSTPLSPGPDFKLQRGEMTQATN